MKNRNKAALTLTIVILSYLVVLYRAESSRSRLVKEWNQTHQSMVSLSRQLNTLKSSLGYGGMIHNFKNYVLRGRQSYYERLNSNFEGVFAAIAEIRTLETLSEEEKLAINEIEAVASTYKSMAKKVKIMLPVEPDQGAIDKEVKIDDTNAIDGLAKLDTRFDNVLNVDVTSALTRSLDDMRIGLFLTLIVSLLAFGSSIWGAVQVIFRPIQRCALRLNHAKGDLMDISRRMESTSHSLSSGATENATSIEQTVRSVTELSGLIEGCARSSDEALTLSREVATTTKSGADEMKALIEAMAAIDHSSKQASAITAVIDDIAFQTNLLALNAAVEAARAGEQGRGFAVVAEAVRELAQRCASAAKEVSELMRESSKRVTHGAKVAEKGYGAFTELLMVTERVSSLNLKVAEAVSEQNRGISEINGTIAEIDKNTQETARAAEQVASMSNILLGNIESTATTVAEINAAVEGG